MDRIAFMPLLVLRCLSIAPLQAILCAAPVLIGLILLPFLFHSYHTLFNTLQRISQDASCFMANRLPKLTVLFIGN